MVLPATFLPKRAVLLYVDFDGTIPATWSSNMRGKVYKVVLEPDEDMARKDYPSKFSESIELLCYITFNFHNCPKHSFGEGGYHITICCSTCLPL